jgi:ATP-dependent Clp protease protease subunit
MDWLKIKNKKGGVGEIHIFGAITSEKWFDEETTPKDVRDKIKELSDSSAVNIYINSPGGEVFAGMTIANMIKRINVTTTAHVEGVAASIASVIALSADNVIIPKNAYLMIHNASSIAMGTSKDMRKTADLLDKISEDIANIYVEKSGMKLEDVKTLMDDETWFNGEDAFAFGLADQVSEEMKIAACLDKNLAIFNGVSFDVDKFKTFPKDKLEEKQEIIEETLTESKENILNFKLMVQRHEHLMRMSRL